MNLTTAKTTFNKSRQQLADALKELENVITKKISENSNYIVSEIENSNSKLFEQKIQIDNLTNEINNMQNNFREVCKENELLHSKLNGNAEMKIKLNSQVNDIIESLVNKINKIDEIISKS